jgi:hypothetical protein
MIDIPGKRLKKIFFDNPSDDLPSKKNRIIRVEYSGWTFFNDPLTTITISIPNDDPTFIFPLQESTVANLEIDWGDRRQEAVNTTTEANNYDGIPHTYSIGGVKKIQVRGTAVRSSSKGSSLGILFDSGTTGLNAAANKNKVLGVNHLNDIIDGTMTNAGQNFLKEAFYGCTNLITAPVIPQSITSMGSFFLGSTFLGCHSLVQGPLFPPNITSISSYFLNRTFEQCTSLAQIPEIKFPNLGIYNETTAFMLRAFVMCTSLTSLPENFLNEITKDTSGQFLQQAFAGCTSLESIPANFLSQIPTALPYTLNDAFRGCTNLRGNTPVDGSGKKFWERYTGENIGESCFYNCTLLSDYSNIPTQWKHA